MLKSVKELLFFLKLTNFYRKFIKKYLNIIILLINLIKNNTPWIQDYKEKKNI